MVSISLHICWKKNAWSGKADQDKRASFFPQVLKSTSKLIYIFIKVRQQIFALWLYQLDWFLFYGLHRYHRVSERKCNQSKLTCDIHWTMKHIYPNFLPHFTFHCLNCLFMYWTSFSVAIYMLMEINWPPADDRPLHNRLLFSDQFIRSQITLAGNKRNSTTWNNFKMNTSSISCRMDALQNWTGYFVLFFFSIFFYFFFGLQRTQLTFYSFYRMNNWFLARA